MSEVMIPNGAGKPKIAVSQAPDETLQRFIKWQVGNLEKDPNGRFAAQNRQQMAAAKAELDRRAAGGTRAPTPVEQAQSTAIERAKNTAMAKPAAGPAMSMETLVRDPGAITQRLEDLAKSFHLVTPVTSVDVLPEGCGVSISFVQVNPDPSLKGPREVVDIGGSLALSGTTLKRIAAAAALDWDPLQCGRLDDGSDPHYCHFRAVGSVRNFDGSIRRVTGEVEMDMRERSPQVDEIREKAAKRESEPNYTGKRDGGASQILEMRKFLLRHAETKAKNRAVADMGVKRSYAPSELAKPFAVARLVWTGQSDDPELRREFARMGAQRMLDGAAGLYGGQPPSLPAARHVPEAPSLPQFRGHAPPPVQPTGDYPDFDPDEMEAEGEEAKSEPRNQQPAAAAASSVPAGQAELKV